MTPDRARELLGGLASGILTAEERQTLFEAALHDQTLFNEVADELEFAVFLQSPETRAQLVNKIAVEPQRRSWFAAKSRWLALTGALAAASMVFVAVWNRPGHPAAPAAETPRQEVTVAAPAEPPVPPQQAPAPPPPLAKHTPAARSTQPVIAAAPPPPPSPPPPPQPKPAGPPIRVGPGVSSSFNSRLQRPVLLAGTVRDAVGSGVPNAQVEVTDPSTSATAHVTADSLGQYALPATALPLGGPYTVTAQAPGFKSEQRTGITLADNKPVILDIPLQVGSMSESVMVTAASPTLPAAPPAPATQQVAVLDFANGTPQQQSGQQVADQLSNQLLDRGQVRIIDREKVKQALEQQAKQPSSAKDAAALGRSLGADAVITGTVKRNGAVTAQVIDTRKGRAMSKVAANGPSVQNAANSVGRQLESQLAAPLAGSVTRVQDGLVTVDFSSTALPHIGVQLDVFRGPQKIGELTLTSAYGKTGAGTYTGTTPARKGDRIASPR